MACRTWPAAKPQVQALLLLRCGRRRCGQPSGRKPRRQKAAMVAVEIDGETPCANTQRWNFIG